MLQCFSETVLHLILSLDTTTYVMAVPLLLRKHWFLFSILGCIMLAEIIPSLGATGGEYLNFIVLLIT